ncbi:MAG: bifunctional (p)ppGpp synthetase/guanosine-3',5'-bis(diphosphate) 3'-pyrophosphohydrolase [bacterium]|nr:bifunctional (p)ppGpp synthetase/guanosine-3',5'-bis(diphosphate) 3'-pyrophosphohydrolase [bacterium]
MKLQEILKAVKAYHPSPDLDMIRRAHSFVMLKHRGQTRASGEPYVTHLAEVAFLATRLKLDVPSVVAALLHDTVEDTDTSIEDLRKDFGEDVAQLVDGVTKLSRMNFRSRVEQQAENFRKMLLAMARDIRILLIKLCDRTHNMRTLQFLSGPRRMRIAQETLDIYAPLAHRLGIHWMKSELEDLALRYLEPQSYEDIKQRVSLKKTERERYISKVVALLAREMKNAGVVAEVQGRPKHFFSIYSKMKKQGLEFNEIHDLIAFRLIVPTPMDCYAALGVVHAAWKPIPGRFKDYVAMPKPNKYQSLHTTVIGPEGARIEVQIRTPEMHDIAERGIAAHWAYKSESDNKKNTSKAGEQFSWLRDLVESEKTLSDPHEFLSNVKDDLFPEEVFVFSPKGDLLSLTTGSTPVDFAYAVHSEIGHHCCGARVNGQQVQINHRLENGDTVEIQTSNSQHPSKDWLNFVASAKAKQRIRSFLKLEERSRALEVGRELLQRDMRKVNLKLKTFSADGLLKKAAEHYGFNDEDSLLAEIGYGKLTTRQVIEYLAPAEADWEQRLAEEESALKKIFSKVASAQNPTSGIKVSGLNDVVFRFAQCCQPLPGDDVVGFITRGRGLTVHSRNCSQVMSFDPQRLVPVSWDENVKSVRRLPIQILCNDKVGLLAELTQVFSANGVSILSAQSFLQEDGKASNRFEVNIENAEQLDKLVRNLMDLRGVISVER